MSMLRTAVSLSGVFDPQEDDATPAATGKSPFDSSLKSPRWSPLFTDCEKDSNPSNLDSTSRTPATSCTCSTARFPRPTKLGDGPDPDSPRRTRIQCQHLRGPRDRGDALRPLLRRHRSHRALKGPLHGGAKTEVLKTLAEVGDVKNVPQWIADKRAKKEVFMGFGHAVYQVEDPRAKHLKELSRRLSIQSGDPKWYDISVEIEKHVKPVINKNCNVDFYSASLQHYMEFPAISSPASSRPAASPDGAPTSSNIGPTTRSSAPLPITPANPSVHTSRSPPADSWYSSQTPRIRRVFFYGHSRLAPIPGSLSVTARKKYHPRCDSVP